MLAPFGVAGKWVFLLVFGSGVSVHQNDPDRDREKRSEQHQRVVHCFKPEGGKNGRLQPINALVGWGAVLPLRVNRVPDAKKLRPQSLITFKFWRTRWRDD
jgi:hypothetical protein